MTKCSVMNTLGLSPVSYWSITKQNSISCSTISDCKDNLCFLIQAYTSYIHPSSIQEMTAGGYFAHILSNVSVSCLLNPTPAATPKLAVCRRTYSTTQQASAGGTQNGTLLPVLNWALLVVCQKIPIPSNEDLWLKQTTAKPSVAQ